MKKRVQWKEDFLKDLEKQSNSDLFYNMLDAQTADDWDGGFTARGEAERQLYIEAVGKRLKNWLAIE